MTVVLGTSGWQYRSWKDVFYGGVKQKDWLSHYFEYFDTVEVNNSFYRLPDTETFAHWHDATPDSFVFAAKMSRYLTHIKRLKDPKEPVQRFLEHAKPLGKKLGPVLLQLPPKFKIDPQRLEDTLREFPQDVRVSVEFRDESWFVDEMAAILKAHNVALCLNDGGRVDPPLWRTADWTYMRFHAGKANPVPCYDKRVLNRWASVLNDHWSVDESIYVYFNNDPHACALKNAGQFAESLHKLDHPVTNSPAPRDMKLS